jgi:membrane associated rhomboid family serine protease
MPETRMRIAGGPDRPWTGPPGQFRWTVTIALIAACTAAFVAQNLWPGEIEGLFAFTVADGIRGVQLWRWFSYAFLHASPGHLLFNMLALYFFGPIVEQRLKGTRFLAFYLICAAAGAGVYWIFSRMNILDVSARSQLVGASGAVLGVIAGGAKIAPDRLVRLLFPPVTLRLVTIAWGLFGIAVVTVATAGPNAGGEAAHLGGLLAGFVLIRNTRWLRVPGAGSGGSRQFWKPGDPPGKFFRDDIA